MITDANVTTTDDGWQLRYLNPERPYVLVSTALFTEMASQCAAHQGVTLEVTS